MISLVLKKKYQELLALRKPHEARTPDIDIEACKRINAELAIVRAQMLEWPGLDLAEKIAIGVFMAFDAYNNMFEDIKSLEDFFEEMWNKLDLPNNLLRPFYLAAFWPTNLEDWANDILRLGDS